MKNSFVRLLVTISALCMALFGLSVITFAQQVADPNFDTTVTRPTYMQNHPKVLFDEAHKNGHTTEGRYKPFADLISNDGYQVVANKEKFQQQILKNYDILVIANALGTTQGASAFTENECNVVRDWVRTGGALLLIADHAPFGAAAEKLAKRFGVNMSQGFTVDLSHYDKESGNPGWLVFTRENGLLATHPITQGRNVTERINRVLTFTGQSLKGTNDTVAFLRLADTAVDLPQRLSRATQLPGGKRVSAAGRSQGIALQLGKGRVVILGEAAMLSAQLLQGEPAREIMGKDVVQMGINRIDFDNRQLALNIMHWLSGLLSSTS